MTFVKNFFHATNIAVRDLRHKLIKFFNSGKQPHLPDVPNIYTKIFISTHFQPGSTVSRGAKIMGQNNEVKPSARYLCKCLEAVGHVQGPKTFLGVRSGV